MKRITAVILVLVMVHAAGTAGAESGGSILDWFLPATDTPAPTLQPAVTETPAPNAFRFREGIRWGMNTQQVKALESTPMTERAMSNWSIMLTDGKVLVSRFTADLVFMRGGRVDAEGREAAVAGDLRGDALLDEGAVELLRVLAVVEEVVVGVGVDQPRADLQPAQIHDLVGALTDLIADLKDPVVLNEHVAHPGPGPASVENRTVFE